MCYGTMIWDSVQRARKQHVCDICGDPIKPGRIYSKAAFKDEGEIGTQKTCVKCFGRIDITNGDAEDGDGCLYGDVEGIAREQTKIAGWKKALATFRKARADVMARLARRKAAP